MSSRAIENTPRSRPSRATSLASSNEWHALSATCAGRATATSRTPGRKSAIRRADPSSRTSSRVSGGASSGSGSHWRIRAPASRVPVPEWQQSSSATTCGPFEAISPSRTASSLSAIGRIRAPSASRRPVSTHTKVWIRPVGSRVANAFGTGSSLPCPLYEKSATSPSRGLPEMRAHGVHDRLAGRLTVQQGHQPEPFPEAALQEGAQVGDVVAAARQPGHRRRVGVDPDQEGVHGTVRRHGTQPPLSSWDLRSAVS